MKKTHDKVRQYLKSLVDGDDKDNYLLCDGDPIEVLAEAAAKHFDIWAAPAHPGPPDWVFEIAAEVYVDATPIDAAWNVISKELQELLPYAQEADLDFTTAAELHYEDHDYLIPHSRELEQEWNAYLSMPYC